LLSDGDLLPPFCIINTIVCSWSKHPQLLTSLPCWTT